MYADAGLTKWLAKNKSSGITSEDLTYASMLVDPEIDSTLGVRYYWPLDSRGADISASPPPMLKTIAAYLYAAVLEMEGTSFMQGVGGQDAIQHPYGAKLHAMGMKKLREVVWGDTVIPELETRLPGRVQQAVKTSLSISGFSGPRFRSRDRNI